MKLIFFLIAFCLVFLRAYFGCTGHSNNGNEGNLTISSDGLIEQMNWSGRITLSDDETAIKSISPGGYLKYRNNDKKMIAESNTKNGISYELYNGNEKLTLDDSGRKFIAASIKELIAWGFDAEGRMERIYKKGGDSALLAEMENIKIENIKELYLDRLFKNDSLAHDYLIRVFKQINALSGDMDKTKYLNKFTVEQLKDSITVTAWLNSVEQFNGDMDKENLLKRLIEQRNLSNETFDKILGITANFGSDMDKENLLSQLIEKEEIPDGRFDSVMKVITHFGSDMDKANIYKKLMGKFIKTEDEWITLINETTNISSDFDKSNLLLQIAAKMPKSENVKSAYVKSAKTINGDAEYGKTMKAIE